MSKTQQLIFVYNAKAGFMHGMMDLVHKTASPKTYPCKLCMVTFSGATMNKLWKRYVANLGFPAIFVHKDEFARLYPKQETRFPVIFLKSETSLDTLISREDFRKIKDLGALMNELSAKLKVATPAKQYKCKECGLHYADEAISKRCEAFCRENNACNLEITKHSIENNENIHSG